MNQSKEITIILEKIGEIIYVDDNNTGYENGSKEHPYNKIQKALDNATDGDTIFVYNGTYKENVDVNKIITITGDCEGIILEGNLIIVNYGNLTLQNVTLKMNCTEDGEYIIEVQDGGALIIKDIDDNPETTNDRTNITAGNSEFEFKFLVNSSAEFVMRNSELSECGYDWSGEDGSSGLTIKTDNTLIDNSSFYNNFYGIYLYFSNNSSIINNDVFSNINCGVFLKYSSNNTILNNSVFSNKYGIHIYSSKNIKMRDNIINGNKHNFGVYGVRGNDISDYYNDIDSSNTINGKPIYYIQNQNNLTFDDSMNIGYLGLISCFDITVKNLSLNNNTQGILFVNSTDSLVENCNVSENSDGIYLKYSSNNTITNNSFSKNRCGIYMSDSNNNLITSNNIISKGSGLNFDYSYNNQITNNNFTDCSNYLLCSNNDLFANNIFNSRAGIWFDFPTNLTITNNTVSNNSIGIWSIGSNNVTITNNYVSNSEYGIRFSSGTNKEIIDNNTITNNYYGIDISGWGYNLITNNNISNNKYGIIISSGNKTMSDNNILNNEYGVFICSQSINNRIINSTISNSSEFDFYLKDNSNITTINTTFSNISIETDSQLTIKNYLQIQLNDFYEKPIENGEIQIKDNTDVIYATSAFGGNDPKTDKNGLVSWILITDRIYNGSNIATENLTNLTIKYKNWEETREINMSTSHTEIFKTPPPTPDLTLSSNDIIFSKPNPSIGETIQIFAKIHNLGEENATAQIEFYDNITLLGVDLIYIPSETSAIASIVWNILPDAKGEHNIIVKITNVAPKESNPLNNQANKTITISKIPEKIPDLLVTEIFISSSIPIEDENIRIFATIHNIGTVSCTSNITFYQNDLEIKTIYLEYFSLGVTKYLYFDWSALGGERTIKVEVWGSTPTESNISNNKLEKQIYVNQKPILLKEIPDQSFDEDTLLKNTFNLFDYFFDLDGDYLKIIYHGNSNIFVEINEFNYVSFSALQNWNGIENITFIATDIVSGGIVTDTIRVTVKKVNKAPEAEFYFILENKTVEFISKSKDKNNDKLTYYWSFGDGETSTEENPIHVYEKDGKYEVILEVSDGELINKTSITINVGEVESTKKIIDSDNDGFTDEFEEQQGTNPNDPEDHPKIKDDEKAFTPKMKTAILTSAVGLGIFFAIFFVGTEIGKFQIISLLFLPLYFKLTRDDVEKRLNGDKFTIGQIYGYIKTNPGVNFTQIKKELELSNGTAVHHLDRLETLEFIISKRMGKNKHYYALRTKPKNAEKIKNLIINNPGITQKEIIKISKIKQQTVSKNIINLLDDGVIRMEKKGSKKFYYIVEDIKEVDGEEIEDEKTKKKEELDVEGLEELSDGEIEKEKVKKKKKTEKKAFRNCPFCGEDFELEKTPKFCPFCKEEIK